MGFAKLKNEHRIDKYGNEIFKIGGLFQKFVCPKSWTYYGVFVKSYKDKDSLRIYSTFKHSCSPIQIDNMQISVKRIGERQYSVKKIARKEYNICEKTATSKKRIYSVKRNFANFGFLKKLEGKNKTCRPAKYRLKKILLKFIENFGDFTKKEINYLKRTKNPGYFIKFICSNDKVREKMMRYEHYEHENNEYLEFLNGKDYTKNKIKYIDSREDLSNKCKKELKKICYKYGYWSRAYSFSTNIMRYLTPENIKLIENYRHKLPLTHPSAITYNVYPGGFKLYDNFVKFNFKSILDEYVAKNENLISDTKYMISELYRKDYDKFIEKISKYLDKNGNVVFKSLKKFHDKLAEIQREIKFEELKREGISKNLYPKEFEAIDKYEFDFGEDKYRFITPKSKFDVTMWGEIQQHCIAGYAKDVYQDSFIFGVEKFKNGEWKIFHNCAVHVKYYIIKDSNIFKVWNFTQSYGKCNKINKELHKAIFLEFHKIIYNETKNVGYKNVYNNICYSHNNLNDERDFYFSFCNIINKHMLESDELFFINKTNYAKLISSGNNFKGVDLGTRLVENEDGLQEDCFVSYETISWKQEYYQDYQVQNIYIQNNIGNVGNIIEAGFGDHLGIA